MLCTSQAQGFLSFAPFFLAPAFACTAPLGFAKDRRSRYGLCRTVLLLPATALRLRAHLALRQPEFHQILPGEKCSSLRHASQHPTTIKVPCTLTRSKSIVLMSFVEWTRRSGCSMLELHLKNS